MRTVSRLAAVVAVLSASGASCAAPGQHSAPRVGTAAVGLPVETAPPNVPAFKPAFPGQTRALGVATKTPLAVDVIAHGFDKPWALAFLPDGQMLVTEKPTERCSSSRATARSRCR